jgi:hypothetical protein
MATHVRYVLIYVLSTELTREREREGEREKKESFIVQRTHRHKLHKNIYSVA